MKIELPPAFVKRVSNDSFLGVELLHALETEKPTAIRLNSHKMSNQFEDSRLIPWSVNGRFLSERPSFTLDPHFHGGTYYPQEAGSQFLDATLRQLELPQHPLILDLCASPGGKSTLIADFLAGSGLLVANEIIQNRAKILKENLVKWGANNTVVSNNSPSDFQQIPNLFDCIVVDAPCSGEGMFRKDVQARSEWSENNVAICTDRQRTIVLDVWNSLKNGGFLIYSTCTFNREENEDNVKWIMDQTGAEIVPFKGGFAQKDRSSLGYYALPNQLETEGLYFAILQKREEPTVKKSKLKASNLSLVTDSSAFDDLIELNNQLLIQWTDYVFAIPEAFKDVIFQLHSSLRLIKMGTECGEIIRKGCIPNVALALDNSCCSSKIESFQLSKNEALSYLHGDTFPLEGKQGYGLMKFENTSLGFIKHLGNRFNNMYPKEWRIRMRVD